VWVGWGGQNIGEYAFSLLQKMKSQNNNCTEQLEGLVYSLRTLLSKPDESTITRQRKHYFVAKERKVITASITNPNDVAGFVSGEPIAPVDS